MARVEAMNLGLLQTKGISAAAGNNSVSSKGNTQQFEMVFGSKSTSGNGNMTEEKASVSQKEFSVQSKDFSKKEDYVSEVSGETQESVDKVSDLQAVENEMKQLVKDVLDIDDAKLEETMEAMGIVITDLLDPSILQQFVLQVAGAEGNVDFLTNEALLQNYNDLFQALTDFMGENEKEVLLLMEVLDTPVPFQEILQSTTVEDTAASQMWGEETADSAVVKSQAEGTAVNAQTANQATDEQDGISTMVEKVTVQKAEESGENSMNQSFSGDAEGGEFAGETMSQEVLQAGKSDASVATETNNSVFAEQLNVVQGNIEQIADVNVNGLQRMQQMVEIVKQVSEQIRSTVDATATTMEMQLNPERLGKVLLTVSAKEGVMTANFKVQSEEAKQALESQIYQLRETLESKNLKVESVDVQISNFDFSQSNEAESQMRDNYEKQGKKKFDFEAGQEEEDMEVSYETPEQTRRRVMRESGSSIDYTA